MVSDKKIFSCFLNISLCKTCNLRGGHIYGPRDIISTKLLLTFLFFVTPIVELCNCSMFCYTLLYVHSSIAIILMGKRELVALLNSSFWCLVMVERLFLAVPWGCLGFVIVVFPDHTHLLFFGRSWLFVAKHQKSRLNALWFQTRRFESYYLENLVLACVTYKVDNQWTRTI